VKRDAPETARGASTIPPRALVHRRSARRCVSGTSNSAQAAGNGDASLEAAGCVAATLCQKGSVTPPFSLRGLRHRRLRHKNPGTGAATAQTGRRTGLQPGKAKK